MKHLEELGYDSPPPDTFAIWKVNPNSYDPSNRDGSRGGVLFECLPSPPMMVLDQKDNLWYVNPFQGNAHPLLVHFPCFVLMNSKMRRLIYS